MTSKEYGSYIKGLIDGANFDTTSTEGKIIKALSELCAQMAGEIDTLRDELDVANDYLEELDHDLGDAEQELYDLEDDIYGDDEDDECDCDCCDCDDDECDCCDCCGCDDEDEEEEFYCAMCPGCNGKVYFDETMDPEDVVCPNCGKHIAEDDEDEETK